ncbi:MAG TPA: BON domain-containing protein [Actinomycetota bacterium]|nr:BON domain-containing protein [Actinomycetota bacterium]
MGEDAGYLAERIHEALATDPRVAEPELEVRLAGGKAFVRGTVPTRARWAAIETVIAERFPGTTVVNEASVVEQHAGRTEERLQ